MNELEFKPMKDLKWETIARGKNDADRTDAMFVETGVLIRCIVYNKHSINIAPTMSMVFIPGLTVVDLQEE